MPSEASSAVCALESKGENKKIFWGVADKIILFQRTFLKKLLKDENNCLLCKKGTFNKHKKYAKNKIRKKSVGTTELKYSTKKRQHFSHTESFFRPY